MLLTIDRAGKGKHLAALSLATLTLALGLTVVLPAGRASAGNCRVFRPLQSFSKGNAVATAEYYVPYASESRCKDINIRNVQNLSGSGGSCATFRVQMFPSRGGFFFTRPKTVCSAAPNGPVVPIATDVLGGTRYRIWYTNNSYQWNRTFQVVD